VSTVDIVERAVMAEMLQGVLVPGTWLRQDDLAERLGVSKIPVREALHRLAANGLLRFENNRGVVVPTMTAHDAEETYQLRLGIEPLLLRRAVPLLSIVDLAEAELALSATDRPTTQANWDFHAALYRAAGWQRGMAMVESLHAAVAPYVMLYIEGLDGGAVSVDEHVQILDACRAGQTEQACSLLETHLREAADALADVFTKDPDARAQHAD
jgi:DNA-binding GntR family transcriptional regulator